MGSKPKGESSKVNNKKDDDKKIHKKSQSFVDIFMDYAGPIAFLAIGSVVLYKYPPIDLNAWKIYLCFYFSQAILSVIIPGKTEKGLDLIDKTKVEYKTNGLSVYIVTVALFFIGVYYNVWNSTIVYDNFWPLLSVVNAWSFIVAIFLLIKGKFSERGVSHGNVLLDLWFGMELNPHVLGLDIKFFSEGRPQLIGWVIVVLSIGAKQYEQYGAVGIPLILYTCFISLYVFDYFWFEIYITSTWDIIAERYGWMLVWGNYFWVPFFYSLQAWYLIDDPTGNILSPITIILIIATFVIGYTIFRGANKQKHEFKTLGPRAIIWGEAPLIIESEDKRRKLLCSGWWGVSRHANYVGDLLLALSFSLPTIISGSIIPFAYPAFLFSLLMHRLFRDDKKCSEKYGVTWKAYCAKVPYRLIPYIF